MLNRNTSTLPTVKKLDPLERLDWAFLFTDPYLIRLVEYELNYLNKKLQHVMRPENFLDVFFSYKGYYPMPRKKGNSNGAKPATTNRNESLLGWVNVTILDEHTPEIERLSTDVGKLTSGIMELVARGYDFSCKWTDHGETCMACIIGTVDDGGNGRAGMSAFASTAEDALAALLFKYYVLLDGQLPTPQQRAGRKFR